MNKLLAFVFLFYSILLSTAPLYAQQNAYEQQLTQWKQKRLDALTAENGWLNLAGLFWLNPGKNTVGSSANNDVFFPEKKIAEHAGFFEWKENKVWFYCSSKGEASINNTPIQSAVVYNADSMKQPTVSMGSLRFTVIKRGDKLGIRLRDLDHAALKNFKGVDRFATDTSWLLQATLLPAAAYKTIAITNMLGQTTQQPTPGNLVFEKDGKIYSLQSLEEDGKLFIVFGDETNAETTYGAGRFLYADMPTNGNKVLLDFNQAINPPCAFTPFATCPLPPKQNQLPIKIEVGEKDYGKH